MSDVHEGTRVRGRTDQSTEQSAGKSTVRRLAEPDVERIHTALAYVPHVARRYLACGIPFDELVAAGNLGLVEAALRFKPSKQVKFVTYADWWIRKSILKTIEEQSGAVRLPRYRQEQMRVLREGRRSWVRLHGEEPDRDQLAATTGFSRRDVERLDRLGNHTLSLDDPLNPGSERAIGDVIPDGDSVDPQGSMIRGDLVRYIREQLAVLEPKQRAVVRFRFGFGTDSPMTLREIGREMGISRERVRQLERSALLRLRGTLG